jgi:hypothetical protein
MTDSTIIGLLSYPSRVPANSLPTVCLPTVLAGHSRVVHHCLDVMAPENAVNDFQFPQSHHLVVVTKRRVLAWDANEVRPIFNSGSAGILAAKESGNGGGTLAIADSQIVLLHKVEKPRERSYRLKGADVCLTRPRGRG